MTATLVTLEGARPVRGDHGAVVMAHGALSDRPDVLLVPGGGWMDRAPEGAWTQAERGEIPQALDDLRAAGAIEVVEARVVDDGDILTAGAPACGLDLSLHLLERFGGPGLAEAAARELQYERPALAVS